MKGFDATVFETAPQDGSNWINFQSAHPQKASAAVASQTAVADDMDAKVNVSQFDEETGAQLNAQVIFEKKSDKESVCIEVPWNKWHEQNLDMGATQSDKASVLILMENIHSRLDASSVNVKIMLRSGKHPKWLSVVAGAKVENNAMM